MCYKKLFIKFSLLYLFTLALILSSCGNSSQKQAQNQQSSQGGEQSGQVPEQLNTIESSVEKIIYTLNGPAIIQKDNKSGSNQNEQSSSSGKSGNQNESEQSKDENKDKDTSKDKDSKNQQSNKSSENGEKQDSQQSQSSGSSNLKSKPVQEDPWEKLTPTINEMHYSWNSLTPLSVKAGAKKELIDNFGNALNDLTNSIVSKNKTNTLMAASHLYSFIPDFYALSKTKVSPEVKRMRYFTRNAILNTFIANWGQAYSDIKNLKDSWSLFKSTLPKEQQENANKLDFSIYEFEKVITDKNQPLSDIKGRVALANIDTLEKAISEKSDSGQSGSANSSENSDNSKK